MIAPRALCAENEKAAAGAVRENSKERRTMVSLADARRVIAAAEKKAAEIGQPMNIAVVDAGGNLVSHVRMDGARIESRCRDLTQI